MGCSRENYWWKFGLLRELGSVQVHTREGYSWHLPGGLDLLLSPFVIYTNISARYIYRRSSLFSFQMHVICSPLVWKAQRRIPSPHQIQNQNSVLYLIINRLLISKNDPGMESLVVFSQPAIRSTLTQSPTHAWCEYIKTKDGFCLQEIWIRIEKTGEK